MEENMSSVLNMMFIVSLNVLKRTNPCTISLFKQLICLERSLTLPSLIKKSIHRTNMYFISSSTVEKTPYYEVLTLSKGMFVFLLLLLCLL